MRFRTLETLLLVAASAGAAYGRLTNITLDDTSPEIIYTAALPSDVLFRCSALTRTPRVCDLGLVPALYNGTSTVTSAPIVVSFTGTAVYVNLGVNGTAMFGVDGNWVASFLGGDLNSVVPAANITGLVDGPHTLTMRGVRGNAAVAVQLDSVAYTYSQPDEPSIPNTPPSNSNPNNTPPPGAGAGTRVYTIILGVAFALVLAALFSIVYITCVHWGMLDCLPVCFPRGWCYGSRMKSPAVVWC
ncbi:hypothetical protein HMN09_00553200 [Mycena chlorophos]|uniref:Uncharacterized protein n=1 Tax=Mycena chlorophos TaxID=658473 RepID=A0A8H6T8Q7_MYCCL|nr:hypothetical protein HMN09_00553200 [Mycena chlorophos]